MHAKHPSANEATRLVILMTNSPLSDAKGNRPAAPTSPEESGFGSSGCVHDYTNVGGAQKQLKSWPELRAIRNQARKDSIPEEIPTTPLNKTPVCL